MTNMKWTEEDMTNMKCHECTFWKPLPREGQPAGWGKCARLSGDRCVTLLADAQGGQIQHVSTPPDFGCNEAQAAVQVLEVIEVYCQICELTIEPFIDAGLPREAQDVAEEHLREHRKAQEAGIE